MSVESTISLVSMDFLTFPEGNWEVIERVRWKSVKGSIGAAVHIYRN